MSFRVISFFTLFFLSIIKFFGPERGFSDSGFNLYQIVGLIIFLTTTIVINYINNAHKYDLNHFLFLFFTFAIISSLLSFNIISILYSMLFLINTICIYLIFTEPLKKIVYSSKYVPIFLVFLMLVQFYYYGVDIFGREVGNFEPNQFSILALCAISLNFFTSKNIISRSVILIISFFLIMITTSRGALGASLIFLFTYSSMYIVKNYNFEKFFNYSTLLLLFLSAVVLLNLENVKLLLNGFSLYFELTSADRGLQSGFTGRDILWINALDQFYNHPLLGSGLRNFDFRTHSTYVLLLSETGILGLLTFLLFLISTLFNGFLKIFNSYDDQINTSISFIVAMFFYAFIEKSVLLFTMPNSLLLFFFSAYIFHDKINEKLH